MGGDIHVGCCGFALPQTTYHRIFDCVEIDSSFYNLPRVETARRWREAAPAGFRFSMKAWQILTHAPGGPTYRRTRNVDAYLPWQGPFGDGDRILEAWRATLLVAEALGAFLVLFQCPASFTPTRDHIGRLERFFARIPRGGVRLGWEPRGQWPAELVERLCRALDLVHVVDPFQREPVTTEPFRYFRLHGVSGYRHRYTDAELRQLLQWCAGPTPVFCFFNNVRMAEDAQRFRALIARGPPG